EGAEIFWEVGEGDGQLQTTSTIVGKKGITDVIYNPKSEGTHVINAYTTDNDLVTYLVNVKEIEFELVGQWELHYFTDDTRTEANQINLINFQDGINSIGLPISTFRPSTGKTSIKS